MRPFQGDEAMANPQQGEARSAFLKIFRDIARHKHRHDVFRDFVTLAACSLHNALAKDEGREAEYMQIIKSYEKPDQEAFAKLLAILTDLLEETPRDVLGPLYMELEISSKDQGQFFTPPELSELMARMTFGDRLKLLDDQPFITAAEPACGAGGMVLSLVKEMIDQGYNPAEHLWVQCIDVSRLAALMCYVQLTLWNVPAEVIVGDTLKWEHREVWYTPAHHLGFWANRLKNRETPEKSETAEPAPEAEETEYQTFQLDWKGQGITLRWCAEWLGGNTAHLEILTEDRSPHPISETGYRSHFVPCGQIEAVGGPVAFVTAWLEELDDGKPVQLSLF